MGAAAYLLWGVFPLYFSWLAPASAIEVLAHRIAWSSLTCVIVVLLTRTGRGLLTAARQPGVLPRLGLAALLVSTNWLIYVAAVMTGHVVEAALGYYINPLLTVLLGVVVLRERLRRTQWIAIALALGAVAVLTAGFGRPPWIAFALAASFALYGLMKNRVGGRIGALHSLTIETSLLLPVALPLILWLQMTGRGTFTSDGGVHALLLAMSGVVTTVPLILFAASAARIPLSTLGLLQYLTPTAQLLMGVLVLGEQMTPVRWGGFALVWLALVVLSVDTLRSARRRERRLPPPA